MKGKLLIGYFIAIVLFSIVVMMILLYCALIWAVGG